VECDQFHIDDFAEFVDLLAVVHVAVVGVIEVTGASYYKV